jgi:transcriptional regulator with XRE-family HTH domain
MIQNERQYGLTRRRLAVLEQSLAECPQSGGSIDSLILGLRGEIEEYERLRDGQIAALRLPSVLGELPAVLARARIARGWRQGDLAGALGITEQQVQKDESGGYEKASLLRLRRVADVLGVRISGRARLPRPESQPAEPDARRLICRIAVRPARPVSPTLSRRPVVKPRRPVIPKPLPATRWDRLPMYSITSDPSLSLDLRVSVPPC